MHTRQPAVEKLFIASEVDTGFQQLLLAKRQQIHHARATCQTLRYRLLQFHLAAACQDVHARPVLSVHNALQVADELRSILHLVKNARGRVLLQESPRVALESKSRIRILQAYIIVIRKQMPRQRRLTRLSRTTQRHHRIHPGCFQNLRTSISLDYFPACHAHTVALFLCKFKIQS